MKILRVPAYCTPEVTASSHLENDRFEAFSNAGFEMEIFTPTPTRGIDEKTYLEFKSRKYDELYSGKIKINRFSMFREGKNPIMRAVRYLLTNVIQYRLAVRAENADVVYGVSTPPTQGFLCAKIKKRLSKKYKKEVPFVYNLQDIFPDSLVTAKMTKKGSLIWKIGRKIEDYTYKNADKIIVISEDFKRNIMEKGVPEEKIVVIPNWVNTDKVYPVKREDNVLFERYGLERDKFYVTYSGNIGHSQNIRMLLDAAKQLREELPELCFVLIGDGAAREEAERAIKDEGIDNVIMLPFQPYEDIAHVFSLGDAGLIISKSGTGNNSVPSKTWSILAAERPIIASFDSDSELSRLIKNIGCGVCASADDIDQLKTAIAELYRNRSQNATLGALGRAYLKEYLDKDKCVGMYVDVIRNTVDNHV